MRKWIAILCLLIVSCQTNEADQPELQTDDAQQIGATSVVMAAGITEIGPVRPVNYGILWDKQSNLTIVASANKNLLGSTGGPKKFSIKIEGLTANTIYYYRGFAANEDYSKIYYSNVVTFTTLQ
ncbi:MAG: hypothetical protein WDN75_19960 [Bacteroidota bacterium]